MNPTEYTKTTRAHWITFDAESDPATWPEGIKRRVVAGLTTHGAIFGSHMWFPLHHGDKIRVERVNDGPDVGWHWRAVEVLSAEEWERQAWVEKIDKDDTEWILRCVECDALWSQPHVAGCSRGDRDPRNHPTESAEEEIDMNKLGGTF